MSTTIGRPIPGASQPKEPVRLIDADELKKRAVKVCFSDVPDCGEFDAVGVDDIDIIPTIDPESLRPKEEWISVKDRLPVAKEVILAYESAFDSMSMAFRLPDTEEFINVGDYYALDAVTHWMPLPKPPKEEP